MVPTPPPPLRGGRGGWRPLDQGRVSKLVADFKSGAYGQNTLAPPSLIDSAACLCDGKRRLDNGLQCVAALQILTGELEESKTPNPKP